LPKATTGFALKLTVERQRFDHSPEASMPWLINWQHWGKNEYVTALEPATHPPIGQAAARENGSLILLEPGESRTYDLLLEVLTGEKAKGFTI
jgi:hypothetical protein